MAAFTVAEATENLTEAKQAYKNALSSKEYDIRDRKLKHQELDRLRKEIAYWSNYIDAINSGIDPDKRGIIVKRGRYVR